MERGWLERGGLGRPGTSWRYQPIDAQVWPQSRAQVNRVVQQRRVTMTDAEAAEHESWSNAMAQSWLEPTLEPTAAVAPDTAAVAADVLNPTAAVAADVVDPKPPPAKPNSKNTPMAPPQPQHASPLVKPPGVNLIHVSSSSSRFMGPSPSGLLPGGPAPTKPPPPPLPKTAAVAAPVAVAAPDNRRSGCSNDPRPCRTRASLYCFAGLPRFDQKAILRSRKYVKRRF